MKIDLQELTDAGVIDEATATRISEHYALGNETSNNRIFTIFGVLGAALVGLGIILILAHNWDNFSRSVKTVFAFLPLLIGQAAVGYTLFKKGKSPAWREASGTFLFCAVGASIALVGQVYNIPGDLSSFLGTWMLLVVPLVYLLPSSVVSIFTLIGITSYGINVGYTDYPSAIPYLYWGVLLALLPHYWTLINEKATALTATYHHWFLPLSVTIMLGSWAVENGVNLFIPVGYAALFAVFLLVAKLPVFQRLSLLQNGYSIAGTIGMGFVLLTASFRFVWEELATSNFPFDDKFTGVTLLLIVFVGLLVFNYLKRPGNNLKNLSPMALAFPAFLACYLIGFGAPVIATVLVNILVLVIGVLFIRRGEATLDLGMLNIGLALIALLITCRFFDTDMSFVIRGLLFIAVGVGFFLANYRLLQKRKA